MKALILIDIQQDFVSGSLAVAQANQIIEVVNSLMDNFQWIVATQDWHPKTHLSFASNHFNKNPLDTIQTSSGIQILWPEHCVAHTTGADFAKGLNTSKINAIFRKGTCENQESYSGFFDGENKESGLRFFLQKRNIDELHFVGLASDICVYHSIKDALKWGFKVKLHANGTKAVDTQRFEQQQNELKQHPNFELIR